MARKKDINYNCGEPGADTFDTAKLSVLMDIRDELKESNRRLSDITNSLAWGGYINSGLRGLRRDIKAKKRCRRPHSDSKT